MDWYLEGKKAALEGYTRKQGKTHLVDKCQENQGVAVDFVDFERGFASGLNKLCTPEGLKALAAKDIKYQRTCESHEDSQHAQKTGTTELEDKIKDLESEISRLKAENATLAAEVDSLKSKDSSSPAPE